MAKTRCGLFTLAILLPFLFSCDRAHEEDIQMLEDHTTVYVDETNALTIEDIVKPEYQKLFKKEKLNRGILQSNTWVKIEIPEKLKKEYRFFELARSKVQLDGVFEYLEGEIAKKELVDGISRNIYPLTESSNTLFVLTKNMGMPTSFYYQLYESVIDLTETNTLDLFKIILISVLIAASFVITLFLFFISKERFYSTYGIILIGYFSFYLFDSGYSKVLFNQVVSNFSGQLANVMYVSVMLPLFSTLKLSILQNHEKKILAFSLINIIISFAFIYWVPFLSGIYLVGTAVGINWVLIYCIIFSYKNWSLDSKSRVFILGFFWLMIMPNFKGLQNIGLIEGGFAEISYTFFLILELATWATFIVLKIRDSQYQRIVLIKESQNLQSQLNHDLLLGQEKERNAIAMQLKNDVSPDLNSVKLLIDQDPGQSKQELDRIIENIRYLSRMYVAPDLKRNDLETEIKRFIALIQSIKPIEIILDYNLNMDKNPDQYLLVNIYRLVQEAINNSLIHGGADRMVVQILGTGELTVINIEDNGKKNHTDLQEGAGLKGIRSRLSDYDYDMKLSHETDQGARLEIEIKNLQSA
ncbi:MAG: hypothetical protein JXR07_08800 [Reichenbachiella sp.]